MRVAKGWTRPALAARLQGWQEGIIGHVERGRRVPTVKFARACDAVFFPDNPEIKMFESLVDDAGVGDTEDADYFRPWVELEKEAADLRTYEPLVMPGLLQTTKYALAVNSPWQAVDGGRDPETDAAERIRRQEIFDRKPPPTFMAVIAERVLHNRIGTAEVMREQLQRVQDVSEHPLVSVQILPDDVGENVGLSGAFMLAGFAGSTPGMVYLETAETGTIARDPERFARMSRTFDTLRTYALDVRASRDRIQKAMEKWER